MNHSSATNAVRSIFGALAFILSILLSAQAMAFDVGGLSYAVTSVTDVEVTGRAAGNIDTAIVIPATASDGATTYSVETIGSSAFSSDALTSVIIPDSVTTIGTYAFFGTSGLTSVIIPDSVTTIDEGAFWNSGLTSVTIGNSVTTIVGSAFRSTDLTSVIIPDSMTTIQGQTFYQSGALASVTIPDSVTTIEFDAFYQNALTSVTIPDSVTTIGDNAFNSNALTSVIIPDSVTSIGQGAFQTNAITGAAFEGNFGIFNLDMFIINPTLSTITYCEGTTGWPQTFNNGTTDITTTSIVCAAPAAATPVPTSPLWLLGIMAGLLSLVGIGKLRKA
jgi:hypothetical protein